jgi:hypothetical protein
VGLSNRQQRHPGSLPAADRAVRAPCAPRRNKVVRRWLVRDCLDCKHSCQVAQTWVRKLKESHRRATSSRVRSSAENTWSRELAVEANRLPDGISEGRGGYCHLKGTRVRVQEFEPKLTARADFSSVSTHHRGLFCWRR